MIKFFEKEARGSSFVRSTLLNLILIMKPEELRQRNTGIKVDRLMNGKQKAQ